MRNDRTPTVWILDLLSVTPHYDQHLVAELRRFSENVMLVAASPHQDPQYFADRGSATGTLIVDRASSLPEQLIGRTGIRRVAKALEYHWNLLLLGARMIANRPDVIHAEWMPFAGRSPADLLFVRFVKRRGIPFVYTAHNVLPHDDASSVRRRAYAHLYREADVVICHTSEAKGRLVSEFGVPEEQVEVIAHGPLYGEDPAAPLTDARRSAGVEDSASVVLSLGVIRPYKGLEFLLEAWRLVRTPGARLIIAGGGDSAYAQSLIALAGELGVLETVEFRLGYVSNADVDALHQAADIAVFPYRDINQSGALMTALAYGRAIVATDVGGFSEVIDSGRNGILVPFGDERALAASLDALLADADLRERFGREALADSQTVLSWSGIAERTVNCYSSLLEPRDEDCSDDDANSL